MFIFSHIYVATASDSKALENTIAEIARFEAKRQNAEKNYKTDNAKVKEDIIKARFAHDQLMDNVLITSIVCQVS